MSLTLCLASQSSARRRLVKKLLSASFPGARFSSATSAVDERAIEQEFRRRLKARCLDLRMAKSLALLLADAKRQNARIASPKKTRSTVLVVGCDQLLFFSRPNGRGLVLGKPGSHARARAMLRQLSGKKASLITAMSVGIADEKSGSMKAIRRSIQVIELHFARLTRQEIEEVLLLDRPYGCAGSFKFEQHGANLFESVKCDDPTGIQGISVMRLRKEISMLINLAHSGTM